LTQQVPVYCINRFLDVPTTSSGFSVSYTEETDPIRKLVACMENKTATHRAKQIAVWMISDNLVDMTKDELVNKFLDDTETKWRKHSSGLDLAREYRRNMPDAPEELIDAIRNLTPEQIKPMMDVMRPTLRKGAESQVSEYAEKSASLLADCGYDLSNKRFFRQ
jgi:hypothetical protein